MEIARSRLLAYGLPAVVMFALATLGDGDHFDLSSFRRVAKLLGDDPAGLYTGANLGGYFAWPYPPVFLPAVWAYREIADVLAVSMGPIVRSGQALGVLALAAAVELVVRGRGADLRTRTLSVALVACSPIMIVVTGLGGQVDPWQWVPVVLAIAVWDRMEPGTRRGVAAGALVALGAGVKTVPAVALLAFILLAVDHRERLALAAAFAVVFVVPLLPFLLHDPEAVRSIADYRGVGGVGGLGMLVDPSLAQATLGDDRYAPGEAWRTATDAAPYLTLALIAVAAVGIARHRPSPEIAVLVLVLATIVGGVNLLLHYLMWPVAFLAIAARVRMWVVLHAVAAVPVVLVYGHDRLPQLLGGSADDYPRWVVSGIYVPASLLLVAALIAALVTLQREIVAPSGDAR